jgi:aspartyl-tRNA(Asn)/glutamyl-tRNA(Gln) amidotransferase subunit C
MVFTLAIKCLAFGCQSTASLLDCGTIAIHLKRLEYLFMSLSIQDVQKIARLSQLTLNNDEQMQTLTQLNTIFGLIDQMSAVDTTGVAPLMHPISMIASVQQRLRTDAVSESNQRDKNMANAPQSDQGYFLVPKVIE